MSTNITVNVSSNKLLQQARNAQIANRQQLTQQEVDDKFVEDVRQIEAATAEQRDGAVPEYRVKEETSAQRRSGFGAWLDVNATFVPFTPNLDQGQNWATDDKIQFNVGSGDGKKWASATLSGGFSGKQDASNEIIQGPFVIEGEYAALNFLGRFPEPPQGAVFTPYNPFELGFFNGNLTDLPLVLNESGTGTTVDRRTATISRVRGLNSSKCRQYCLANYLTFPVDSQNAIIVVSAFVGYVNVKSSQIVANPPYTYSLIPTSVQQDYGAPGGYANIPAFIYTLYYELPEEEFVEGVTEYGAFQAYYRFVDDEFGTIIATPAEVGLPTPNPDIIWTNNANRDDFAFVVNGSKARQINVPSTLKQQLLIRYPSLVFDASNPSFPKYAAPAVPADFPANYFGSEYWNYYPITASMGAGVARGQIAGDKAGDVVDFTNYNDQWHPPSHMFGTPGIFDYVESGFKDYLFHQSDFTGLQPNEPRVVLTSDYAPGGLTPIFTPDPTRPSTGYSYLSEIRQYYRYENDFGDSEDPNLALMWAYLKPSERTAASARYSAITAGFIEPGSPTAIFTDASYPQANPSFYFSYFPSTDENVEIDLFVLPDELGAGYTWISANTSQRVTDGFMQSELPWQRVPDNIQLSSGRILPPSLQLAEEPGRTLHPYINVPFIGVEGGIRGYSYGDLALVAWTAWKQNWRSKLAELGFTGADFKP